MNNSYISNIRWILNNLKQFKTDLFCGCILVVLSIASKMGIIGMQKFILDDIIRNQEYEKAPILLTIFAIAVIAEGGLAVVTVFLNNYKIEYSFRISLTEKIIASIHTTVVGKYFNERITKYVDYLTNDVIQICSNVGVLFEGIKNILLAAIIIIILFYFSPIILIGTMFFSLLYVFLGKRFVTSLNKIAKDIRQNKSDILIYTEEQISATREVIVYGNAQWEYEKYNNLFNKFFKLILQEGNIYNKKLLVCEPFKWGVYFIVLAYGGYCVVRETMTIGSFIIVYQYSIMMINVIENIYNLIMNMTSVGACVNRVRAVLEDEKEEENDLLVGQVTTLTLNNISFKYENDGEEVLSNIQVEIPLNKKVAFIGKSGAGKSTISRLLIRFYEPYHGEIIVNGISLGKINRDDWAKKITICFQEPYLFPDTIKNNLLFGNNMIPEDEMINMCKLMHIHDDIFNLEGGYDTVIGERGITLSGGQRQRIALARALLRNSDILVLDEATSALDIATEKELHKNIDNIRNNKCTIIIAHRLSTIFNANIIYVLDKGAIVERGTHQQLMQQQNFYYKLVAAQLNGN